MPHSFFNENWQELESTTDNVTTTYVWGLRYIDDLICREKGQEKLYSLADPNWNVVAVTDGSGSVVERMKYDAFGKITWLDEDFDAKNESDYAWNRTFTGQVLDRETGLMLYRNRCYHVELGRFVNRDPIGYRGKDRNLYRYVFNRPIHLTDSKGTNADCIRQCEDDCYRIHIREGTWNPIKWARFTGCVAGCPSGCNNQDFTLCNYINNWPPCYKAKLQCACGLASLGDVTFSKGAVGALAGGLDCACGIVATMQDGCRNGDLGIGRAITSMGDCLLDIPGLSGIPVNRLAEMLIAAMQEYINNLPPPGNNQSTPSACSDIPCKCK